MQLYSAPVLALFALCYGLLGLLLRYYPPAYSAQKKLSKHTKTNFLVLLLVTAPVLVVFWSHQLHWVNGYLLVFICLSVFCRSLGPAYRDFWLIDTPLLLYAAGHLVFYQASWFNGHFTLEGKSVFSLVCAVLFHHTFGLNEQAVLQPKLQAKRWGKTFFANLLIAGSLVFLAGEIFGWFWQQPPAMFYWAPLFLWLQFVFVQEWLSKIGFFFNLQVLFSLQNYSAAITSGLFSAGYWFVITNSFAASVVGLVVGLTTAAVYSLYGSFISLLFHSFLFLLSYLFFSMPL